MNIILITDLYPAYEGHSIKNISYALHYFVRQWIKTENVLVIRPYVLTIKNRIYSKIKKDFILDGVRIINCPVIKIPKLRVFYLYSIYKTIKKIIDPDLVIAHLGFNLLFGHKLAKHFKLPLISAVHNGDFRFSFNMLSEEILKSIYKYSSGIACRSLPLYERFVKWSPELKKRSFIAYSGINKKIIEPENFALSKVRKWDKNRKITFISVCSLIQLKNIDINLKALANLGDNIQWKYKIIGTGIKEEYLKRLTDTLNLADKVQFLGYLSRQDAIDEMKNSDIFIMISSYETFGIAYLEAIATGNIVIASKGIGIDGVIIDKKNGFLCNPGDQMDLLRIINEILFSSDLEKLEKILLNSNKTIQDYTEKKAAHNYLQNIIKFIKT